MSFQTIREFYKTKRTTWSRKKSYYGDQTEDWGKIYGYEFPEPYTEEEVIASEEKMGCRYPEFFRGYLINVSRELFTTSYPTEFKLLQEPPTEFLFDGGWSETCCDCDCWNKLDIDDDYVCEKCIKEKCPCETTQGLVVIGDRGCEFNDEIVIHGKQKGSVWATDSENLLRIHKTFEEYVTKGQYF